MALGTGLGFTENFANTDVRTPDRPVHNDSLSHLPSYQRVTSDTLINGGRFSTPHNLYGMPRKTAVHLTFLICPTKNPRLIGRQLPSPAV